MQIDLIEVKILQREVINFGLLIKHYIIIISCTNGIGPDWPVYLIIHVRSVLFAIWILINVSTRLTWCA